MKRIAYMMMVAVAALVVAGCHCKDKCCGTCQEGKEAVKKACCGTCGGDKKAEEAPAKPAAEKPKDHPAH